MGHQALGHVEAGGAEATSPLVNTQYNPKFRNYKSPGTTSYSFRDTDIVRYSESGFGPVL